MEAIADELGYTLEISEREWDSLFLGLQREHYDIVANGFLASEVNSQEVLFSEPYYITSLQLVVRESERQILNLEDCHAKKVGTLKSSHAQATLKDMGDVDIQYYENEINAFDDLKLGRIDAVLFDYPTAAYAVELQGGIKMVGDPIDTIAYVMFVRKDSRALLAQVNEALQTLKDNGKLRSILERWRLWNQETATYLGDFSPSDGALGATAFQETLQYHDHIITWDAVFKRYLSFMPILLKAAWITLKTSIMAMLLATAAGFCLAIMRVYGPDIVSKLVVFYIEIVRGTPLLIQLMIIYYGLPSIGIQLPPMWAGILGLSINYAAFEAENYRAGLLSVPSGQMEAARALGMTHFQGLLHVVIPQAFRTVLPPLTNDFISLLKDSSLISIITIVELTKAYTQLAIAYYDFFGIGILVALIYLMLGLPFIRLARWAEKRLHAPQKRPTSWA